MKYVPLLSLLVLASCNSAPLSTGQNLTVELIGTEAAHCVLSTDDNRYALDAPGTAFVERDSQKLKVDCDDNYTDRRRTMMIESHIGMGYWNYPEVVTVDFSTLDNGNRFNGYRAEPIALKKEKTAIVVEDTEADMPAVITEILTEDSYSQPVETTQDYPVKKDHYMGRRSYPVTY